MIQNWKQFNEAKIGTVMLSDTLDNLSAEFNLSKDIIKIKKEYQKIGKKGILTKVISLVDKIGEDNYNKLKSYVKKEYHINNLPKFELAKDTKYWNSHWGKISTLITVLGSMKEFKKIEGEKLKKEIELLSDKLSKLEKINESWEDNYEDFLADIQSRLEDRFNIDYDKSYDVAHYYHDKGWLYDMWETGLTPDEAIDDLKEKDNIISFFK